MRENQDGTIVLTDGEWNRSRFLHNGNYLLWGMELKLLKQLANGAKFEKVAEYNEEELRIIYKYEKALKDQEVKMRMRFRKQMMDEYGFKMGRNRVNNENVYWRTEDFRAEDEKGMLHRLFKEQSIPLENVNKLRKLGNVVSGNGTVDYVIELSGQDGFMEYYNYSLVGTDVEEVGEGYFVLNDVEVRHFGGWDSDSPIKNYYKGKSFDYSMEYEKPLNSLEFFYEMVYGRAGDMFLKPPYSKYLGAEGGEQYDYYTIERDYDEGYMNARVPTLKTNRLFDPLYYTQYMMMNDMSDRISTAFHPNAEVREQSGYGTREKQRDAIFNGLKSWNEQMIEDLNGVKRSIDMELGDRKFEAETDYDDYIDRIFTFINEKVGTEYFPSDEDEEEVARFKKDFNDEFDEVGQAIEDANDWSWNEILGAETFEAKGYRNPYAFRKPKLVDTDKYEGHTKGSWDRLSEYCPVGQIDRSLIADAPMLLEEVKDGNRIKEYIYQFAQYPSVKNINLADLIAFIEEDDERFEAEESINPKDYIAISFLDQQGNGHPTTLLNTYDLRFGEKGSTYFKALREALDKGVKRGDYEGYKIKKTTSKPLMDADFDYETPYNNEYGYQVWLMGDKFFYGDSDIPVVKKNKYTINEGEPKFADMVSLITTPKKKRTEPMDGLGSLFGAEDVRCASCMLKCDREDATVMGGRFICSVCQEDDFYAETFEAKGIDTFTEPFAELRTGSILNKAILLGSLGAGAMIGLKLRK